MQTDLIIINDYCTRCDIEPDFVRMLGEGELIDVEMIDDTDCFPASQLGELERYTHLYYDLSIACAEAGERTSLLPVSLVFHHRLHGLK